MLTSSKATAGDKSLTVTWREPGSGDAPILGYLVRYKLMSAATWAATMDATGGATARTTTVTGLTNAMEYEVQISARNSIGVGMWSTSATGMPKATTTTTTTGPTPAGAPAQVVLTSTKAKAGDKTLEVSWREPGSGNAPILGYQVGYMVKGGTAAETVMDVPGGDAARTHMVAGPDARHGV